MHYHLTPFTAFWRSVLKIFLVFMSLTVLTILKQAVVLIEFPFVEFVFPILLGQVMEITCPVNHIVQRHMSPGPGLSDLDSFCHVSPL